MSSRGRRFDGNSGWGPARFRAPHPRGLRGKNIGLYYRDKQLKQRERKREFVMNLKVPGLVISQLISSFKHIDKIAPEKKNFGIDLVSFKQEKLYSSALEHYNDENMKESSSKDQINMERKEKNIPEDEEAREPSMKQLKIEAEFEEIPGTSSMPDINAVKSKSSGPIGQVSLRGAGDFKYGYQDIITGSFSEKLEASLAQGIKVAETSGRIADLSDTLHKDYLKTIMKPQYKKLMQFRETLPTYKKRGELRDIISNNQVIVISGETGCGKSTQVPQIILDDAIMAKRGGNVKILVTQPRRIAASSLAMRVASERAEVMGNSVGYAVRLEKVEPRARGSIMFCTTGVLLVDLEINQGLTEYSHVILDEVHERDSHIDLAMCMLKQVLQKRKDLKLILMSATLDADKLCTFFDNCPMMHIEGLAFPVKDIYLEEVLSLTGFQFNTPPKQAAEPDTSRRHYYKQFIKNRNAEPALTEKAIQYRANVAPWLESVKKSLDRNVYQTLQDDRIEDLNIDLIYELLKYICRGPPGAILVFLPGIGEITKLLKLVAEKGVGAKYEIHPLHSKLPTLEQHRIFERPPEHTRKIIVATNIAETSITIDDIVYVIDSGRIKINGLNVEQHINTLKTEWVSQANLRQRRGRAGRCQPGVCYHLLTSYRASHLEERLLPELQRTDLLEAVLSIKRLRLGKAADALKNVPDCPAETTIHRAVRHLQQCGALNDNESLTPLGWHLARLPLHPAAGKLLLLSALFGCLDRAASVAAVWSFKDPFLLIIDKEDQAKAAKRELALGEPSDHVAISEAVMEWERLPHGQRRSFAYEYYLSPSTLDLLSEMKKQLGENLRQMGFLPTGNVRSSWENRNIGNLSLFKAIVAASLYPNITSAKWINLGNRNPNRQIRVKARDVDGSVTIHPSSVMSPPKRRKQVNSKGGNKWGSGPAVPLCSNPGANWLVYWLKQRSSDLFLIDVTMVYTLPLLFFGELKVSETEDDPNNFLVSITNYKVQIRKDTAGLLLKLRALLDEVLATKVMASGSRSAKHSEFEEYVLNAVIAVITAEDERAEYLEGSDSDNSEFDSRY